MGKRALYVSALAAREGRKRKVYSCNVPQISARSETLSKPDFAGTGFPMHSCGLLLQRQGRTGSARSLLDVPVNFIQLLQQVPGHFKDYREEFESRDPFSGWTLDSLKRIFMSIGAHYTRSLPLVASMIVDAMDESEEERRQEIVRTLHMASIQSNSKSVVMRVFLASRPNEKLDLVLRRCLYMKLEDETSIDIINYVRSETNRIAEDLLSR